MLVAVLGFKGMGMARPALTQIDVGMVGDFFDEVMVKQWREGWQEENVQADDDEQPERDRCPAGLASVAP